MSAVSRTRARAWWLLVVAAAVVLLAPRRGAAAEPDRCVAAWALAGLAPGEHARLAELCRGSAAPDASDRPLLVSLVTRGGWEAALLGELVPGAAPHLDLGPDREAATRLWSLRLALRHALVERRALAATHLPVCKDMRAAMQEYLADRAAGEVPIPPMTARALTGDRCLALEPAALAEVHLLTIAADDAPALTVTAGTADRVVVQWFSEADALEIDGRRVFVVAVPRWSVVTVQAVRKDVGAPATWHGFLTRDATVWDRPPEAGCLRLSVDLGPETTLLLDGRPLTRGTPLSRRTVGVVAGPHELVAVRCEAGRCAARFRETLAERPRTTTQNLCEELEIDLQQAASVAVLRTSSTPGCDQALAFQVGALAADHLRRSEASTGKQFRDLKAYASLTDSLAALKTSLNPTAGQAVGGRGGADSLDAIGTVAKEAWRQGIDELVTFELRCDARGLTLSGSVIGVQDVFAGDRGVQGLDLQALLRVESVRFRGPQQLASAVAGVLDRLFRRDFVRFREGSAVVAYRQRAQLELLAYAATPERRAHDLLPVIAAFYVGDPRRRTPEICGLLARDREAALARVDGLTAALGRRRATRVDVVRSDELADASPYAVSATAGFRAQRPGTYLVVARWPGDREPGAVADATCVRFEVPDSELWGAVMWAPDLTARHGIHEVQSSHVRAHFGHTWYRPVPWLGFGVFGAYAFTNMVDRDGLPSWIDVGADQTSSRERLQWYRHSVQFGPLIEARSRRATLPVELRARLHVGFGVAITDVQKVPSEFAEFRTPEQINANDLRLSPVLDAILELGVGYHVGPLTLTHAVMLGGIALTDMATPSRAATALNGSGMVLGISLGIGGTP